MSPLLLRIEQELLVESDTYRSAELRAKRASYLARVGRFQEASEAIVDIRRVFGDGRSGRVTAFVMLAEAMVMYYDKLASGAADRVARAKLLGHAMKDREVIALASAWLAFFEFEQSKFQSAIKSIQQAGEYADSEDHSVWSRCSIVLLNCFALCGDSVASQYWFMKGREHALKEGDQAGIDALLHSKAVFGVAWLRSQGAKGLLDLGTIARIRLEVSSARNLQKLAGIRAHADYIELAHTRLLILEGKFEEALEALQTTAGTGPFPAGHYNDVTLQLERAFCLWSLGRTDQALASFDSSTAQSFSALDVDDRVVAVWMMRELAAADPRFGTPDEVDVALRVSIEEHDRSVSELRALLAPFVKT